MSWLQRAACRGEPTDLWFPPRGRGTGATALAVCAGCPVKTECLDDALAFEADLGISIGIRGGVVGVQREVLLHRRAAR